MASNATLSQLLVQVRDLADEPATGGFADDDRLTEYINHAYGELHDLLVNSFEDIFINQQTINLVSGTESYALPNDFYKTYAVFAKQGDHRFKLKRFVIGELDKLQDDVIVTRSPHQHLRYRVVDSEMWFTPMPSGGEIEHWYIYQFTKLADGADTVNANILPTWEDFIICSAAHRLLVRGEGENAPEVLMLKEQARQRVINSAQERDAGDPHRIYDVSGRFSEYGRIL